MPPPLTLEARIMELTAPSLALFQYLEVWHPITLSTAPVLINAGAGVANFLELLSGTLQQVIQASRVASGDTVLGTNRWWVFKPQNRSVENPLLTSCCWN